MNQQRPSRRGPSRLHLISTCVAVCAAFFFAGQTANAQDIAEAARQEKARKATPAQKRPHVYTNEDLKRAQILTPEDRAPIEARKRNPTSPTPALNETSPADASTQDATASESLGEIARRVRQEKSARQAEQVRKRAHQSRASSPVAVMMVVDRCFFRESSPLLSPVAR